MKCPNPKCREKPRLETKKTLDNGSVVERRRQCPSCGLRFTTVERFQVAIVPDEAKQRGLLQEQENARFGAELDLHKIQGVLRDFAEILNGGHRAKG